MLFQLQDVHQSIQMGTFRGNLGTSDRHCYYTPPLFRLLEKRKIKVSADEKGLLPTFIPPFTYRFFFQTTLRIRLRQACEEDLNN